MSEDLLDLPLFDLLHFKFKGEDCVTVYPFIEVLNGDMVSVTEGNITLKVGGEGEMSVTADEFVKAVEEALNLKTIESMSVQLAKTSNLISIK